MKDNHLFTTRGFLFSFILLSFFKAVSQEDLKYQVPPLEILELADAPLTPSVSFDDNARYAVLFHRNRYISVNDLAEPEFRLAGLRINPVTNTESRAMTTKNISILTVGEQEARQVNGLPENPRLDNFSWSPDQTMMAFTHTTETGLELWLLDIAAASCRKITGANLNGNLGRPFDWFTDNKNLLVKFLPDDRKPLMDKTQVVPSGPRISVSEGKRAQNRTYQDLLNDKTDEFNFEQLARASLYKVNINGEKTLWKDPAIYTRLSFSPGGNYVLATTISKPFSYLVPYRNFPSRTVIFDLDGNEVKVLLESPLLEDLPQGFMATEKGMRNISWRSDKPATLFYVVALDDGDPSKETGFRDEIFELAEPFTGQPRSLLKTVQRFAGITWGTDDTAIAYDRWWNTRNAKTYLFNPSDNTIKPEILFDLNYQDNYASPGSFLTKKNNLGEYVLQLVNGKAYLTGPGYSPEGIRPFFREYDIKTRTTKELWRADGTESLENIIRVQDPEKGILITRIESATVNPNYFIRNINRKKGPEQVTFFKNPFSTLGDVYKEVITYKREDGVELSGTLYLPSGYDREKKEKLPLILWAYPLEFKDAASAGQVTTSPHVFTAPSYGSPVFWVTRGYVILDGAAFPIIGEGKNEPNDTFVGQLVANARAAIDAVDARGFIDRKRVAVGGHSYGAFMTANLLSHSDLFAAGIARSGAYNRTLTPFGFQSEERTYWDAPEIYYQMSPFMHADKMKTPLLLIHGEADNNSGTFPLQSERYFNALKGMGAQARLVFLPLESHGYAARESILHMLWEQDQWLEKWVKGRK